MKKTLLSARGTLQDLGLASQIDTKSNLLALIIIYLPTDSNGFFKEMYRNNYCLLIVELFPKNNAVRRLSVL
jgi:hypothetical protein